MLLLKFSDFNQIVSVVVDGIYYKGDVEVGELFSEKEQKTYNNCESTSEYVRYACCDFNTYEGEAAILLENSITSYNLDDCKLYCTVSDHKISTKLLFKNLYLDFKNGATKENIIINFIYYILFYYL